MTTMRSTKALLLLLLFNVASPRDEEKCRDSFYGPLLPCPDVPIKKYYYHTLSNSCREFEYRDCSPGIGNKKNMFDSMEECISTCYDLPSNSTLVPSIENTSIMPVSAFTMVTLVLNLTPTSHASTNIPIHGQSSSTPPPSSSSTSVYQKPPQPTSVSYTHISSVLSSSSSSSNSYSSTIIIYQEPPHPTASSSSSKDEFYNQLFIYGSLIVCLLVILSLVIAGSIFVVMYLSYRQRKRVLESSSPEMPSSINSSSSRSDESGNSISPLCFCILPHSGSQSSTPSELIEA